MTLFTFLRIVLVLVALLTIPGWFLLAVTNQWRNWQGLQRWTLALGLSLAFFPILFYQARWLSPWLTFGPFKLTALLLVMLGITLWRLWPERSKIPLRLGPLAWITLAVFLATLATRYWLVWDRPIPAWTDSLHHTILTQLTAVQGQLPRTTEPYFPIPLDEYHLGLYALTASVQWLAQVPAHTALLWTMQTLNGLAGVGVYFVLDRRVGRVGAIIGAVTAGLLSHQPAFYVNWGRFTQLSSQTILLIAWLVTWEALRAWRGSTATPTNRVALALTAALLSAAVFLYHFRVAVFYLPLVAGTVLWELWETRRSGSSVRILAGTILVGGLALFFVTPALLPALEKYVAVRATQAPGSHVAPAALGYYAFPWTSLFDLGLHRWLAGLTLLVALIGLVRRQGIVIAALGWAALLIGLGYAYLLRIPLLTFTNLGAVLIMLYLPASLILGAGCQALLSTIRPARRTQAAYALLGLFLAGGLLTAPARATDVEDYRYFVTPADLEAMAWIQGNTPPDALFAINTTFWLPTTAHGTDGGYWIPYFTRRSTTAGPMISAVAAPSYRQWLVKLSHMVVRLESDPGAVADLRAAGVDYIYVGEKGNFSGVGLQPEFLRTVPDLVEVYGKGRVAIFQVK